MLYIGLMSGTSADSLDAALVDFSSELPLLIATSSTSLSPQTRQQIHKLAISGNNEIDTLSKLDREIANISASTVIRLCEQANIQNTDITAIGSHGQTIRHYPATHKQEGYSLQVGDPNIIAELTGITTISDFRRRDIATGGQGAPLAPVFHQAAFQHPQRNRIVVNLGGIANLTWLPTQGTVIGYDTGPANGLMDTWCQIHQDQTYDKDGKWASQGKASPELLSLLLSHPFFSLSHPKSTGREDFNLEWLQHQLARFAALKPVDIQATLMQLTVESLSQEIEKLDSKAEADIFICGGGAFNTQLMNSLKKRLSPRAIETTQALGVPPDWVEAMAFAWLAKQTMERLPGNLPSVTGAKKQVILGGVYYR